MSSRIESYQDLKVWQKAIDLVPMVYRVLKRFPKNEQYAMADQVRRAVVSVPANIAEGQARQHPKEFLQGLYIARGSLAELETLLIVAERLGYITTETKTGLNQSIVEIRKMLHGLISRIRQRV